MKKTFVFLALLAVLGCEKESATNSDYFIFGYAYGFCAGNCVTVFKLEGDNLYADDDASYQTLGENQEIPFQSASLSAEKVNLAKALQAQIPANLYNETDGNVGCPDCRDQGLYYIKIKMGNTVREWRIDPDSQEYKAFGEEIRETVDQLK